MSDMHHPAAVDDATARDRAGGGRPLPALLVALVGGALAWATSLSYGFDDGRYETWQIAIAGAGVAAAVAMSRLVARHRALWATVVGVTAGFAAPWVAWARADDPTGLWGVGALMLVVGLLVGCTVVGAAIDAVQRRSVGRPATR